MAIKDFKFLRNDRGLKNKDTASFSTFRDVYAPIRQKTEMIRSKFDETTITRNCDLEDLTDISAIANSLVTLFSTRKGGRPLVPTFGLDLREYIAEPLNEDVIYVLREDITREIEDFEPRVKVKNLDISKTEDDNELRLDLECLFPELPGTTKNIFISLKNTGEVFTGIS